ncbi:MAG: VCBS repeat-containing protein [Armatimonadetes bacterium]|nr:VCBS repeat-containing protein [Armatimonadota bacterium]
MSATQASLPVLFAALCLPLLAAAAVQPLPLQRDTALARAVILVPDDAGYLALGRELAAAIQQRTGTAPEVRSAAGYVAEKPRRVKPELLDRPFILIGQFWSNAVLERLYAGLFDPTDAVFPGPGGYELRTICNPFVHGQTCLVVTGSDLAGCRLAVQALPPLLEQRDGVWVAPFLHRAQLTGEAAAVEANCRKQAAGFLAELDHYAHFGTPQTRTWTGEDPRDLLVWHDRNTAAAALFGLRYWVSGSPDDGDAFKRLVAGCRAELPRLEQAYAEGRSDLIEYSLDALTLAWDLVEETDLFSDAERAEITDWVYRLAWLNRGKYFVYKCLDRPLSDVMFWNRHQIAGTFWLGMAGEYFLRSTALDAEQQQECEAWRANAEHYLDRLEQSYFYSDGTCLMNDEGGMVLRYALRTGRLDLVDRGSLRLLADYWALSHSNLGFEASNGHNGNTQCGPQSGEVLNAAEWLHPGEGYGAYRRRLARWPYTPFLFYAGSWTGFGFPFYNWETPADDTGAAWLQARLTGVTVQPLGEGFDAYLRRYPELWQGGYQRTAGRYLFEPAPYEQSYKRLGLRSGFARDDQYLVLDGLQGTEWSYDDLQSLVAYDDLGERLLKAQWDARTPEGRLELNTLAVSNGTPGSRQSVAARLLTAFDAGPYAAVASTAALHDGVAWTRRIFWEKQGWIAVADEVLPQTDGDHFLAQTWLSFKPFALAEGEATLQSGPVTLHVLGTPGRRLEPAEGGPGVRQIASAHLAKGVPVTLWTLLSANSPQRPAVATMRQVGPQAVLVGREGEALLFSGEAAFGGLRLRADMGVVTGDRLTLAGCREVNVDGQAILQSADGVSFGCDVARNRFEPGKAGFGLQAAAEPAGLRAEQPAVAAALRGFMQAAGTAPVYMAPELSSPGPPSAPALTVTQRAQLPRPVSLANNGEDLALYDPAGKPRFALPAFRGEPVLVDFDGAGHPDLAFALGKAVAVYHPDGTLRFQHDLTSPAAGLAAGDLDGDGRQELGVSQHNWATVLDGGGKALIDEEAFRYTGLGGAFGDVDGDGATEFVAVTTSGLNSLRPNRTRKTVAFQSAFGVQPCRVWLRDLDRDGVPEACVGGSGTDLAVYDLKAMRCRWSFTAPLHPRDVTLFDVDGDGEPELVAGCADGFLYVVGRDGKWRISRSAGAPVTCLCAAGDRLLVGLATGDVLLLGRDLAPMGTARLEPAEPVTHLAALRAKDGTVTLVAAGDSGSCLWL